MAKETRVTESLDAHQAYASILAYEQAGIPYPHGSRGLLCYPKLLVDKGITQGVDIVLLSMYTQR